MEGGREEGREERMNLYGNTETSNQDKTTEKQKRWLQGSSFILKLLDKIITEPYVWIDHLKTVGRDPHPLSLGP